MSIRKIWPLWWTLAACGGALPVITDADVERAQRTSPTLTRAALERGRQLYFSRCGACHEASEPRQRTAVAWDEALAEMSVRARLEPSERALVRDYLHLFAAP